MSETEEPKEPKKYYEYHYTWAYAEARRKVNKRNGSKVCDNPMLNKDKASPKQWVIWYNRQGDSRILPTGNARYYDK